MRRAGLLIRVALLACSVASLVPFSAPSAAQEGAPTAVEELMLLFSGSGGVRADFREVRSISILVDPIVTSGVLYFDPPDLLARHATAPWTSRVVVNGKLVEFQDETGEHRLELDASALAEAVVSNLMFVLRGDLESLRASFEVSFESDSRDWKLTLVPRSRALRSVVKAITLSGRGRELASMQTLEVNGDATALHLSGVQVGATWSEQERASIFSIHPK